MTRTEMLTRIAELSDELSPIEEDIKHIELQLIEARASIKAVDVVDHAWRARARDALNHLRRSAAPIRAEIKQLNIARMTPEQSNAKATVKLENRFADVFMNVAKSNLPKNTYNKLRKITQQKVFGDFTCDEEDLTSQI